MIPHTNKIDDVNSWLSLELSSVSDQREKDQYIRILNEDILKITSDFGHSDQRISESQIIELQKCVKRLLKNEPIQYVTGKSHFYNLIMDIGPGALIPRPETEELVDLVVKNSAEHDQILDLCTGSGCIALAIKKALPHSKVTAVEKYDDAINQAKHNSEMIGVEVSWCLGDIFEEAWMNDQGVYNTIVSNPPYIPEAEKSQMDTRVVNYEPEEALFVKDQDPLKFYRRIGEIGRDLLTPNGNLMCEGHENLMGEVKELWLSLGYSNVDIIKDLQGKERIAWANK